MHQSGIIPLEGGAYIDVYNKSCNRDIAGTIHTRISSGNYWYVTRIEDSPGNDAGIR